MTCSSLQTLTLSLIISFSSFTAQAAWQLDNTQSRLSYISIKKGDVAEINHFTTLSGRLDEQGKATLSIQLDSVKTQVDLRDERMRTVLFETSKFSQAQFSAQFDLHKLQQLAVGSMMVLRLEGEFSLHGIQQKMPAELAVSKLSEHRLQVSSYAPLVLDANYFQLAQGVEKLRELAGLPSISMAVPVSFVLIFKAE